MAQANRTHSIPGLTLALFIALAVMIPARGQGSPSPGPSPSANAPDSSDPLAGLTPENRELFEALRNAARLNDDATTLAEGKRLLPALTPGTPLCDFVTELTAGSAVETGDTAYALSLLKPFTAAHPDEWRAASLLARAYAETGDKTQRDRQIAYVIALHKSSPDPSFTKMHIFPIQKVALHSGYAVFLYPFQPLPPDNVYLLALIYTPEGKLDYRIELESEDGDQAFFKPEHPGDRRFSIDSIRQGANGESQALHGFVDGSFDYDRMRDQMVKAANGEKLPAK
jgi:hypothetical protein